MVEARTPCLVLREFEEADAGAVREYAADPEVVRPLAWGPDSEERTRKFVVRALGGAGSSRAGPANWRLRGRDGSSAGSG